VHGKSAKHFVILFLPFVSFSSSPSFCLVESCTVGREVPLRTPYSPWRLCGGSGQNSLGSGGCALGWAMVSLSRAPQVRNATNKWIESLAKGSSLDPAQSSPQKSSAFTILTQSPCNSALACDSCQPTTHCQSHWVAWAHVLQDRGPPDIKTRWHALHGQA
jgi:hypothetical protein